MTIIEIKEIAKVPIPGDGGAQDIETRYTTFEYINSDPVLLRGSIGLDGSTPNAVLSERTREQIATRLYRNGFMTEAEVRSLGGKIA